MLWGRSGISIKVYKRVEKKITKMVLKNRNRGRTHDMLSTLKLLLEDGDEVLLVGCKEPLAIKFKLESNGIKGLVTFEESTVRPPYDPFENIPKKTISTGYFFKLNNNEN